MRLAKERVHHMADSVVARLHELQFLEISGDRRALRESLEHTMTEELMVEDRLNAEVRRMMQPYERQIEQGQVDYQKMFTMIKQKLVRERGIQMSSNTRSGRSSPRMRRQSHVVALVDQDFRQQLANADFVVNDQNDCHALLPPSPRAAARLPRRTAPPHA